MKDPEAYIERLARKQKKFDERIIPFENLLTQRNSIAGRMKDASEILDSAGYMYGQVMLSEYNTGIQPQAFIEEDRLSIGSSNSYKSLHLPSESRISYLKEFWSKDSKQDNFTVIGWVGLSISVARWQRKIDRLDSVLDLVERAAANPELNYDVADSFQAIILARANSEDLTPEQIIDGK